MLRCQVAVGNVPQGILNEVKERLMEDVTVAHEKSVVINNLLFYPIGHIAFNLLVLN